jgi:hypothetical protein
MSTKRYCLALLATLSALACAARAQDRILPGYWESVERVTSPIPSEKTERRCITPRNISRFMSCYINHHYDCVCPEQSAGQGRITFRGECVDHKGQHVRIEGDGNFTPLSLHLSARATFKLLGIPIAADAVTDAKRLGDTCPPGSIGGPSTSDPPETFR